MSPPDHPTPRTDAAVKLTFAAGHNTVCPNFARTLERELTETERLRFGADADRRRLRAEVERWELAFQEQYARAEKAGAALAFIAENGGTTHETECGTIACNGSWCAEQARAAIDAARKEQP